MKTSIGRSPGPTSTSKLSPVRESSTAIVTRFEPGSHSMRISRPSMVRWFSSRVVMAVIVARAGSSPPGAGATIAGGQPYPGGRALPQGRGEAERTKEIGTERRDLGDSAALHANHVEFECAVLAVARRAQVGGGGRHPVRAGTDQAPLAHRVVERSRQQGEHLVET